MLNMLFMLFTDKINPLSRDPILSLFNEYILSGEMGLGEFCPQSL